jgi:hypothetical protein
MMVHRLLQRYLDGKQSADKAAHEAMCEHSSEMEVRASEAERASIKYKMVEYMADKVAAFEAKDEFETAEQHAARVTPESIAALKAELTAEAEKAFIEARASSIVLQLQLGEYDAENQIFPVTDLVYGQYIVNVPLEVAREFKSLWDNTAKTPTLCVENDTITVDKITFRLPDGKEFVTK